MTKRRQTEIAFGSDAFLDVVANIVGILIILIVVAGVKVGRAPVPASVRKTPAVAQDNSSQPSTKSNSLPLPAPLLPASTDLANIAPALPEPLPAPLPAEPPEQIVPAVPDPAPEAPEPVEELPPLPTLQPSAPPAELLSESVELEAEIEELKSRLTSVSSDAKKEKSEVSSVTKTLEMLKAQAEAAASELYQRKTQLTAIEENVRERQHRLSLLSEVLESRKQTQPPVKNLEHRLTPVGQSVEGDELHFRLEGNRVSYVPVMDLATLVRADMERHKEILLNRSYYKGTVGPRNGYRMEFLVQREAKTLAEEFRSGSGLVRVLVTQWIIVPDKSLETETAEEALKPESRFVKALRQAKGKVTITLWVYPDSFALHQTLKEAIHEAGLSVASRPLPTGIPIAGSPEGTKSVSQ